MATEICSWGGKLLRCATLDSTATLGLPCHSTRRVRSQANCPISKLGDDLVLQILIRVPELRSAFRCKSVCKRWNSLISSPYFNSSFVSHQQSMTSYDGEPPLLPFDDPQSVLSFIPVRPELKHRFVVMDSFKDLLLCGFVDSGILNSESDSSYIICNPFTKQYIALPLTPQRLVEYEKVVARLVCQPAYSCNLNLAYDHDDDDGGRQGLIYSEYRFCVVCLYETWTAGYRRDTKLDVFCSESGEWKPEALVLYDESKRYHDAVSLDGNLYWASNYWTIVSCDPFHVDSVPPASIRALPIFQERVENTNFSTSQGALHIVLLDACSEVLSVWTLEVDGTRSYWWRRYQVLLEALMADYELDDFDVNAVLGLHPEKPEIVFLRFRKPFGAGYSIFSCNLRKGELEEQDLCHDPKSHYWKVFQPRFFCCPTPIPRYEELRRRYDGGYSCLLQDSGETTPPISEEQWQQGEGVEEIGKPLRKNKRIKITAEVSREEAYGRGRTNGSKASSEDPYGIEFLWF